MDGYISNKNIYFVDGLEKFCRQRRRATRAKKILKRRPNIVGISKRNSTSKIERRSTSSPLILGRSFLKTVGAIDISKWEINFDINGVRSAFKSTLIRGM
jgi:hypothetical protein